MIGLKRSLYVFEQPVFLGTVVYFWNQENLLTDLQLIPHCNLNRKHMGTFPSSWEPFLAQVKEYFDQGKPLESVPWDEFDQTTWSDFQREVYLAIEAIPHGETRSYSWVASRIRRPLACRAVGQALKRNPIPVLIPCHRVVNQGNGYGGFMGKQDPDDPEMAIKRSMIELERSYRNPYFSFISAS